MTAEQCQERCETLAMDNRRLREKLAAQQTRLAFLENVWSQLAKYAADLKQEAETAATARKRKARR